MTIVLDPDSSILALSPLSFSRRLGPALIRHRLSRRLGILHRLFVVPPPSRPKSQAQAVHKQDRPLSGAYCIGSCQHAVRCAIQPADLPLVKHSRGQSPHEHGYRHSNCGLRQGPGDTSRIDESDKEQNVLSASPGPAPRAHHTTVQHPTTAWNSLYIDARLQPKDSHLLPRPWIPRLYPPRPAHYSAASRSDCYCSSSGSRDYSDT